MTDIDKMRLVRIVEDNLKVMRLDMANYIQQCIPYKYNKHYLKNNISILESVINE